MKMRDIETMQSEALVKESLSVGKYGEPHISINALAGITGFRTMRITGSYRKEIITRTP